MGHAMRAAVWATGLALLPTLATAQQPDPEAMERGAKLYSQTCARCHNPRPATERSDREWSTIVLHMRARGNLTKSDADAILTFLQAVNGDDRRSSARDATRREDLAAADWQQVGAESANLPREPRVVGVLTLADYLQRLRIRPLDP